MSTTTSLAAPVSQSERILLLDSLRGIAILGILLMNMPAFAMAPWAEYDPYVNNEIGTINYRIWYFVMLVMNGTQRALFSMLFGAGVILFIGRKETNLAGLAPADYFFRRQLWLIAISTFDVYILLWHGDILLDYACYGMLIFTFRKLAPKQLIITAAICLLFLIARENRSLYERRAVISEGEKIAAIDTTTTKLTELQKSKVEEMTGFKKRSTTNSKIERTKKTNEILQASYADVYKWRTDQYIDNITNYLYLEAWDVLVFMFLGMAFFKSGVLTGDSSVKMYLWMTLIGLGTGLALSYLRIETVLSYKFNNFDYSKGTYFSYYQIDRAFRAIGFLGLVMLLFKSGVFGWFFAMLRPTGQMALTNYLGQSIICGIIFNGYGFGMFGKMQRYEIYIVLLAVWAFQIIFSAVWMRYFLYGPFEWVWRSLTYWRRQPFLKY